MSALRAGIFLTQPFDTEIIEKLTGLVRARAARKFLSFRVEPYGFSLFLITPRASIYVSADQTQISKKSTCSEKMYFQKKVHAQRFQKKSESGF